jgi:hypothetical protein
MAASCRGRGGRVVVGDAVGPIRGSRLVEAFDLGVGAVCGGGRIRMGWIPGRTPRTPPRNFPEKIVSTLVVETTLGHEPESA